jgi:hypothetical protein
MALDVQLPEDWDVRRRLIKKIDIPINDWGRLRPVLGERLFQASLR